MAPGEYARLSDSEAELQPFVDDETANEEGGEAAKSPLRPHVYYDDGPFDAPSSESEDETLFEKNAGPGSPGLAESGLTDINFRDPKVGSLLFPIYSSDICPESEQEPSLSSYHPWKSRLHGYDDRNYSCQNIPRDILCHSQRIETAHYGSCLQRNLLCATSICAMGPRRFEALNV